MAGNLVRLPLKGKFLRQFQVAPKAIAHYLTEEVKESEPSDPERTARKKGREGNTRSKNR